MRRIGFLSPATEIQRQAERDAFLQEMRALGYVDGRNIRIEYRWAEGRLERLPELARELADLKVSVIVAHTTPGALAAKRATQAIPIVMTNAGDPVGSHLVASLARPGGNVTGLSMLNVELGGKRLALLKEIVPDLSRAFIIWNPDNHGNLFIKQNTEVAAGKLGIRLRALEVRNADDLRGAFRSLAAAGKGGLIVVEDVITTDRRTEVAEFAAKIRMPAVYGLSQNVDSGGLLSYGIRQLDFFRRSAHYVDKILKGGKPADLPVEQPTTFELVINLKAARALGIRIPQSVLFRADRVIE
jgi:putative ABC transport system substrate-binding protein